MAAGAEDDEEVCWCAGGARAGKGGVERGEDGEEAEEDAG